MWGVAKLVGDAEEERYGVGFWEGRGRLVDQLGWEVSRLVGRGSKDRNTGTRREDGTLRAPEDGPGLTFPTWSWASIADGTIEVADRWFSDSEESFYQARNHVGGDLALRIAGSSSPDPRGSAEPRMETTILDIQGLFGTCVLGRTASCAKLAMNLQLPRGDSAPGSNVRFTAPDVDQLWVVPDTLDIVERADTGEQYNFVLLAASCRAEDEYKENVLVLRLPREGESQPMLYFGFGLILEKRPGGKDSEYQRVGLFRLEGLKSHWWAALCHACGLKFDESALKRNNLGQMRWNEEKKIELW